MLVLTIFTLILSACDGTTIPVTGSGSAIQTLPAAFIAVVENITGDQWTINGQTVTIDPNVVSGGPFNTGDLVKVEVVVNQDGSFTISSVETPSVEDLSNLPRLGDGADNANDANSNENTNVNSNEANGNANNNNFNDNVNVNSNDNNASNVNSNDNTNNSNDNNGNDANSNDDNDNNNENGNDDDNGNENDNDSSGPGSGGDDNDDSGGNDDDSNDNG